MSVRRSYRWMQVCLGLLYDRVDDGQARAMLMDPAERAAVYEGFAPDLLAHGMPDGMFATSEGESLGVCLLYTSPSPRDRTRSRMPSSA